METKIIISTFVLFCFLSFNKVSPTIHKYEAIFSFGDSIADTGNHLINNKGLFIGNLPNGMTFGKPTGRCSDGRLIIDFIAEELNIPLLPPYLKVAKGPYVRTGVNFAVAGSTALDVDFLREKMRPLNLTIFAYDSLNVQLGWFKKWTSSLYTTGKVIDLKEYFKKSLFFVGEFGANDYGYPSMVGASSHQMKPLVHFIIKEITNAIIELVNEGVVNIVVPGLAPPSCFEAGTDSPLFIYHNKMLQESLQKLRNEYPHVKITYVDYYGAYMVIFRDPKRFGFNEGAKRACCGGGGPYNFNASALCGQPGSSACTNPSEFVCWEGDHLTEAAHKIIAKNILHGPFTSSSLGHFNPFL